MTEGRRTGWKLVESARKNAPGRFRRRYKRSHGAKNTPGTRIDQTLVQSAARPRRSHPEVNPALKQRATASQGSRRASKEAPKQRAAARRASRAQTRRRRRDADARGLHRSDLGFRIALAARDDGAGVAHGAALGRRAARDEAGHRLLTALLGFVDQELGGVFFSRAADFADHDDRLGFIVGEEHFQHVDELGALDRIAADTDSSRLAEAFVRGLEHCLIGQGAGTRYDTHLALLEDVARHDADLALVRGQDARAVRAEQARLRAVQTRLDAHHVLHRNAFGDAGDEGDLGLDGLDDGVGRACRRDVDDGGVGAGALLAFGDRGEDRQAFAVRAGPGLAALGRVHAADHLGAVIGQGLFGVEAAGLAGQALNQDLGVLIDEDGHVSDLLAQLGVRAFQTHDQRHLQAHFLHRSDDALGDDVALHDAAEDVDEDALDLRVSGDDLEGRRDLVLAGAAADVAEVGGLFAVQLDDVHRRHSQAGAVDHAADVAVQRHVGEIPLRGLDLLGVFFGLIAQGADVFVAVQGVAVEADLGVQNAQMAVFHDDQRVDLEHVHVLLDEGLVQDREQRLAVFGGV
uniref:NAD-specific glutamate dehydrogenase n=1 Tax=Parastrongyloides trichosuri TaxID=131310 RepID=A0A0N5A4I4_PARTI